MKKTNQKLNPDDLHVYTMCDVVIDDLLCNYHFNHFMLAISHLQPTTDAILDCLDHILIQRLLTTARIRLVCAALLDYDLTATDIDASTQTAIITHCRCCVML
jgi:hypothetical protein